MNTIKNIFLGAALTVIAAPVFAQTTADNVGLEASKIIKSTPDAKLQAKAITALAKPFKKDAKALSDIGRAFLQSKDYDNAKKYGELAVAANKKSAVGYILLGEIAAAQEDGGTATMQYQQAMMMDPKDPEGYRRYAAAVSRVNPQDAIETLEKLRAQRPDYPVDLIAAEIQGNAQNYDAAISYYDKVDKSKMKDYQITNYAFYLMVKQNYDKSLQVSNYGNKAFPTYGPLNRISMYNNVSLKNFDEALVYADRLFNKSDTVTINAMDHQMHGLALSGVKRYEDAISAYKKVLSMDDASASTKNEVYKSVSDAYKEMGNYALAAENYETYLKGISAPSAFVVANLAAIYTAEARDENTSADRKAIAVAKADEVYAKMVEQFPQVADYATQQRAQITYILDPEGLEGKAQPHYLKLAELVEAKAEKGKTEMTRLKEAYTYLMVYNFKIADDVEASKSYANKILEIAPEDALAKQIAELEVKKKK